MKGGCCLSSISVKASASPASRPLLVMSRVILDSHLDPFVPVLALFCRAGSLAQPLVGG